MERYLVGSIEERHDDYEVVSRKSPLGESLVGRKPGETTSYEVNGNEIEVELFRGGMAVKHRLRIEVRPPEATTR